MKRNNNPKTKHTHKEKNDIWTLLLDIARKMYFFMCTLILILILFFRDTMQYIWNVENKNTLIPQCILLFTGCGIVVGSIFLYSKHRNHVYDWCKHYVDLLVTIGTIMLFFIQLYISYQIYFYPGWDAMSIVHFAERMEANALDEILPDASIYFSVAPNNILLTVFFKQLIHVSRVLGIFTENNSLMMLIAMQCLISSLAVYLVYRCIRKLTLSPVAALVGWLLCVFFVGFSPWMVFPYSDATGMLFPILTASIYILWGEKHLPLKWLLISGVSVLGYQIKPQTTMVFLAILIVEALRFCKEKKREKKDIKRELLCLCTALLMAACTWFVCEKITANFKEELQCDMESSFGILHYAMLGLNEENTGMYSFEDVAYSAGFSTKEERNQGNLLKIKERLTAYGSIGLLNHWAKKTIANYGDGTFGWGGQSGGFFIEIYPEKNEHISPFLRSLYYSDGAYFQLYFSVRQACWLLMLLLMGGATLYKGSSPKEQGIDVLAIAILGLTLFEIIFEAHAKYLYTHAPIFVILAVIGLHRYYSKLPKRQIK